MCMCNLNINFNIAYDSDMFKPTRHIVGSNQLNVAVSWQEVVDGIWWYKVVYAEYILEFLKKFIILSVSQVAYTLWV